MAKREDLAFNACGLPVATAHSKYVGAIKPATGGTAPYTYAVAPDSALPEGLHLEVAEDGAEIWDHLAADFTMVSAYSFLAFNLLCAPCFAAMGAIKREMNNGKWTAIAIGICACWPTVHLWLFTRSAA